MLIVSHDRHLLRLSCDQLLLVYDGRVDEFSDELDAYPSWLAAHGRATRGETASAGKTDSADQRRERRRAEAEQRKALQPLRRALEKAEAALAQLQTEQGALEAQLADNALYEPAAKAELQRLLRQKGSIDERLAAAEEAWLNAAEALEEAAAGA